MNSEFKQALSRMGFDVESEVRHTSFQHGLTSLPEYRAWQTMRLRCHNPANKAYASYGGRGITVCDRWRDDFIAFLCDMGRKPSPDHELDRRDNDKGYTPENCRWVTRKVNDRNRRSNRWVTYRGQRRLLIELCEQFGVRCDTARCRMNSGWSVEKNEGLVLGKGAWRCTSSWEPILMLAKERHYFSKRLVTKGLSAEYEWANQRNVWSIASEPQKEKHYASFPVELPARCISAGVSTDGYCSACGSPIIPSRSGPRPTCKCGQVARTGVVLDPFVGSGRSLIAAARLGANAIGVELNADYVQMARRAIEREMPMWPVSIEQVPVGQVHGGAA